MVSLYCFKKAASFPWLALLAPSTWYTFGDNFYKSRMALVAVGDRA
jgi:hypothetical protein